MNFGVDHVSTSYLYLIILIPAASAAILLLGGKLTDAWGHLLGTAAPIASFVLGVVAFLKLRDDTGPPLTQHVYTGSTPGNAGTAAVPRQRQPAVRPAVGAVRAADHRRRQPDPHLLDRLHGARRASPALLRLPQPVRRRDAHRWCSRPTTWRCSSAGKASAWRRTC